MHLGVCYHPEQWPQAQWADDARRMADLGLSRVRIGEQCWSRLEPRRGRYEWAWLDDALDALARAGLQVVMSTPTAAPPKWLVDRHPAVLAVGADGRPRAFGSRRPCDISSDVFFEQARRITTCVAERYGRHPAVCAWQVDHEYGSHDTVPSHSAAAVRRFRLWLRERYGGIEQLNQAWGNVAWSQEYGSFDEIDAPAGAAARANPAHGLDFRRFASDEVVRFNRMQCGIVREHAPGRPVLHNFAPLAAGFDHRAVAADLDVVAWNSWPLAALQLAGGPEDEAQRWAHAGHPDFAAFHHDLYRGMGPPGRQGSEGARAGLQGEFPRLQAEGSPTGRQPFWVMEQQVGPADLARWNPAPASGMVRLWTWEAFAHGAHVVSCARWRQVPFGQEQAHAGLHAPNGEPDAGAAEVMQVARELPRVPAAVVQPARVALVFDHAAHWLAQEQPPGAGFSYLRQALDAYGVLRSLALDVDVVGCDAVLSGYGLVVVPSLPIVPAALLEQLQRTAAQVVLYPRCGSRVPPLRLPDGLPPGALRALIALRVVRAESLPPAVGVAVELGGMPGRCTRWREHLQAGPDVQADASFAGGDIAVARQGRVRYLAGEFDPALTGAVLARAAADAGLSLRSLPPGVRMRRRGDLVFVFNRDDQPHEVPVPGARWLVGSAQVAPHGVSIAHDNHGPWPPIC
jgi:beta-galactosidase